MNNALSTFIGALIAIMILLNGTLASATGNYLSTVIVHIVGLLALIFIFIIKGLKFKIDTNLPFVIYTAGFIGVFTVLFNNFSFIQIGASLTLAIALLGQSIVSIIIDHFGLLGMEKHRFYKKKLIGFTIIIAGITIMTIF